MTMFLLICILAVVVLFSAENFKGQTKVILYCSGMAMIVWLWVVMFSNLPDPIEVINYQLVNKTDKNGQITQYYMENGEEKCSPYKDSVYDTETCYVVKQHHRGWLYGIYIDLISYQVKKGQNNE